jgi:hypothetical protein
MRGVRTWPAVVVRTSVVATIAGSLLLLAPASTGGASTHPGPVRSPATNPSDAIDQSTIDAAMARLRDRQQQRKTVPPESVAPRPLVQPALVPGLQSPPIWASSNLIPDEIAHGRAAVGSAPAGQLAGNPATQPALPDPSGYSRDFVTARKIEMLRRYDLRIARARQALRRHELSADDVRQLLVEQGTLLRTPLDRYRDLLIEADTRNAQRIARYRQSFGDLAGASRTVITILMKAGLVDSAAVLPDDPLSEELELSRGVRRVYYTFHLPPAEGAATLRRHNGYVEFQLSMAQGLWVPTWADLDGDPIALFDAEAFAPLRPYHLLFDAQANSFVVAQEDVVEPVPLFSLLSPRTGLIFAAPKRP